MRQAEFSTAEIADLLGIPTTVPHRTTIAVRWMRRMGLGAKRPVSGVWYCTREELREHAEHLWAEAVARGL